VCVLSLNWPSGRCRICTGCLGWPGVRALARAWVRALGRPPLGAGAGRVKPGSGARAGQTRIGRAGGSNPKRDMRRAKKRGQHAGANKTAVATVLAETDLTPPFDLNPGLNLGLNHTKNLRFKPRFKPGIFCGGFKPRFKPRVGVRCGGR
jgi:hypothetical protein